MAGDVDSGYSGAWLERPPAAEAEPPMSRRLKNRLHSAGIHTLEDLRAYVTADGGWDRLCARPQMGPRLIGEAAALLGVRNPLRPDDPPAARCPHCGQWMEPGQG
jgi:hypothetical protein